MSDFALAIADRISKDGRIAQILAELGPSSTRTVSTLRDVLADVARTSGPLNAAGLASIVYFFSDKTAEQQQQSTSNNNNNNEVVGLSSALLGSIVSGRGRDSNAWNLETVVTVLSDPTGTIMHSPTNVSWGGADMCDLYIGSVTRDYVVKLRSPVPGLPLVHQQ